MINSLSQFLANTPYNVPVTPSQQTSTRAVAPVHQSSSQSNTFSTELQHAQSSLKSQVSESEHHSTMSIYELENKVTTAVQDRVNDTSADIQAQKQSIWQLGVQRQYIESQQEVLNAYVVSATGESVEDTSGSLFSNNVNEVLTEKYMALVEQELKLKYGDNLKPEQPKTPNNDVHIQPVPETLSELASQQVINQYYSVQHQGRSSLLHLSV